MKKILSLVLAAVLTLSLAACGNKTDSKGDQPAAPASALDLLEKVWNTYTDDEKFPASGGDYSEANSKEDAPGVYDLTDRAAGGQRSGSAGDSQGGSGRVPGPHDEPEHLHRRGVPLHR